MKMFPLFVSLFVIAAAGFTSAEDLPDVRPEVSGLIISTGTTVAQADVAEGCAGGAKKRRLLRFDQFTWNDGPGDLVLGDPGCPDCASTPNPVCTNPLFECSVAAGHNHAHLKGFSGFSIRRQNSDQELAHGHKEGWCLVDERCNDGVIPKNPHGDTYLCTTLTSGCADVYPSDLGCQYVDITGLPIGKYVLDVHLNENQVFQESNFSNNAASMDFEIKKQARKLSATVAPIGKSGDKIVRLIGTVTLQGTAKVNPATTPVHLAASSDGTAILNVTIASKSHTSDCAAKDQWKKNGSRWSYSNKSGLTGDVCSNSSRGLQKASIVLNGSKADLDVQIRVPSGLVADAPIGFVLRLVQDEEFAGNDTLSATRTSKCSVLDRKKKTAGCS